jgi:hypothetical protein
MLRSSRNRWLGSASALATMLIVWPGQAQEPDVQEIYDAHDVAAEDRFEALPRDPDAEPAEVQPGTESGRKPDPKPYEPPPPPPIDGISIRGERILGGVFLGAGGAVLVGAGTVGLIVPDEEDGGPPPYAVASLAVGAALVAASVGVTVWAAQTEEPVRVGFAPAVSPHGAGGVFFGRF